MSLPPDRIFVNDSTESPEPEDPFGFFPSENPKTVPVPPVPVPPVPIPVPLAPAVDSADRRRPQVPRFASLVRFFAVIGAVLRRIVAVSRGVGRVAVAACATAVSFVRGLRRPVWRLPAWRLPAWRLPAWRLPAWRLPAWRLPALQLPAWRLPEWRLPAWQLPRWQIRAWRDGAWRARMASVLSQARPAVKQIAGRTPLSGVTLSAFACGIVVGGSAVWLSSPSRQAGVQSTTSQQTPREVPRAAASPVAPIATAFANPPVVQVAQAQPAPATAGAAIRRPRFQGSLVVNSRPSGARVFVNGRSVGQTPLVLKNQQAGSRAIRVALDGYEPWSGAVQVVADTETHLRAELRAQRPAAQP